MKNNIIFSLLLAATIAGGYGCVKQPQPDTAVEPAPAPQPKFVQHRVTKSGETFTSIAVLYTGKGFNWTKIRDANPSLKPNRLQIGSIVNIPAEIVTKKDAAVKAVELPVAPKRAEGSATSRGADNLSAKTPVKADSKPAVAPVRAAVRKQPVDKRSDSDEIKAAIKREAEEATKDKAPKVDQQITTTTTLAPALNPVVVEEEPKAEMTSTTMPAITPTTVATKPPSPDRIDPAPDKEREKLLDELLTK